MERNFLGIKNSKLREAKFIIFPVPVELTTSFGKGTQYGPESIISVSEQLEFFDEKYKIETYLSGIHTLNPFSIEVKSPDSVVRKLEREAKRIIKKNSGILISIGGEHTITCGLVNGFKTFFSDLKVLVFDAHADLRDKYQNSRFSHACVSRRIAEGGVDISIVGVRSLCKEDYNFAEKVENVKIFYAYCLKEKNWEKQLPQKLKGGKYYLSIDVDFFDPSLIPEVGTPEPGGFFWDETVEFLENFILRDDVEIVGFDVVELAPKTLFSSSAFICSKLIYKIMSIITVKTMDENRTFKNRGL